MGRHLTPREWPAHRWEWPQRLRAAMADHDLTPRDLAEESGVSLAMIRMMLSHKPSNQRNASPMVQASLADALGEDAGWVFPRTRLEKERAEAYRIQPAYWAPLPRHRGLEVAHSFTGRFESVAEL